MWLENELLSLAVVSGLSFLIASAIYLIGRAIAEKGVLTEERLSPYACGEDVPPVRPRMDISRFFTYMLLFLVFDITIPVIAMAVVGRYTQAIAYLAIMLLAVLTPTLYLREIMGE